MKIWVDDIRTPPDDTWLWCKTSEQAKCVLVLAKYTLGINIEVMSLDHDLGGNDTTRPVMLWCCENEFWPGTVVVHSANPVGREWLEGMIERYKV
jgi:hypothetical protein